MRVTRRAAALLASPISLLLLVGVIGPSLILLVYSFYDFSLFELRPGFHLEWYHEIVTQALYRTVLGNTLAIAAPVTLASVIGGYAIAYYIVFVAGRRRNLLVALVVISMLASYLARVYAWRTLMGDHGIVNSLLESMGVIDRPIGWLLFSRVPVVLAEINLYMPITALICFASLSGIQDDVREASRDLGAGRLQTLWRVTLPLSGVAIFGSLALCFFLSSGDYITPAFLGGPQTSQTFGTVIAAQVTTDGNYPLAAALSFAMVGMFLIYSTLIAGLMRGLRLLPRTGNLR